MNSIVLSDAWIRALYPHELPPVDDRSVTDALAKGELIFGRVWTQLPCAKNDKDFETLAQEVLGVTKKSLLTHIGHEKLCNDSVRAGQALKKMDIPDWVVDADKWWESGWGLGTTISEQPLDPVDVLMPLIQGCVAELLPQVTAYDVLIGDESTVRKVLDANLPLSSLRNCVSLSIAQYSIDRKLGLPDSIQSLRNREGAESFFRSFPVVWRGAYTILYNWQTYILEVLQMLDSHREEVLGFAFSNSGYNCGLRDRSFVSNFELGQGDTHNKGKSVVEIELRLNDDSSTLYFKPQLFYNGALWHSVLDLVGVSDQEIARTESLRVEGRGVLEKKIVPNELVDPALVSNRLGQLTAIVYFLGGNDMHHENVVIVDDRPCLIDVETILHPSRQAEPKEGGQGDVALQLFENSVLDVGILPAGGVVDEGGKVQRFDVSVIGVSEVQRGAVKFPKLVVEESEFAVRNEWGDFVFNDPLERRGELRHQLRAFIEGFEDLYRRLLEKRDQLHDLIISSPGVAFRRITRPTAVYGKVLMESYHPDFTTSGVTQSAIHAKLFARFFSEKNRFELLSSEVSALRDFDIPHFSFALNAPEGTDSPYLVYRPLNRYLAW